MKPETAQNACGVTHCAMAERVKLERDDALRRIDLAAKYLKHHHMSRPGIAAIVQLLTMPEKP